MSDELVAQRLIIILRDKLARVDERDDAAMDLGNHDSPMVQRALLQAATDPEEHPIIQASAGESLATIWLRRGVFRPEILNRLTPDARAEAEGLIRGARPEWLTG